MEGETRDPMSGARYVLHCATVFTEVAGGLMRKKGVSDMVGHCGMLLVRVLEPSAKVEDSSDRVTDKHVPHHHAACKQYLL